MNRYRIGNRDALYAAAVFLIFPSLSTCATTKYLWVIPSARQMQNCIREETKIGTRRSTRPLQLIDPCSCTWLDIWWNVSPILQWPMHYRLICLSFPINSVIGLTIYRQLRSLVRRTTLNLSLLMVPTFQLLRFLTTHRRYSNSCRL